MIKINDCLSNTYKSSSGDFDDDTLPLKNLINKHPKYEATAYCARVSSYYTFNTFLITFLITTLTLTTFSIDCKLTHFRLLTTFILFLTVITFKWAITNSLAYATKLTSLDKYSNTCLFFIGLISSWHALVGVFWEKDLACSIDKWVLFGFVIGFLLIHLFLISWLHLVVRLRHDLEVTETKIFKLNKDKEIYIVRI